MLYCVSTKSLLLASLFVIPNLLTLSIQRSLPSDDSYVAAVLEYQFLGTTSANLANYIRYIEDAAGQGADIVVFPELTLNMVDPVEVPVIGSLSSYPIPALRPDLYHEVLVSISQAALQSNIYVVINIEEVMDCIEISDGCPEVRRYLFNTNVVFGRNGAVIDRYRKINLVSEVNRSPALNPDLGVFDTDFGVRFGHFISFDLLCQVALQVVQKGIADIIYPTMWFSGSPYLTSVQIQEAFAYAMNVNFLGAGANNVRAGSAGSGIYSGKAGSLISIMPGHPTSRLLVARVPKVPGKEIGISTGPIYDDPTNLDNLILLTDPSLVSHVTKPLVPGSQWFQLVHKDITCTFRIHMSEPERRDFQKYKYRAGAYSGPRYFSGTAVSADVRICSVFACTGDSIETCGRRFPRYSSKTTAVFNEMSISATVTTPDIDLEVAAKDSAYYSVSVDTSIMPLEPKDFTYNEDTNGNITVYTLALKNIKTELYGFGIWGRVFEEGGEESLEATDTPTGSSTSEDEPTTDDPNIASVVVISNILINLVSAMLLLTQF